MLGRRQEPRVKTLFLHNEALVAYPESAMLRGWRFYARRPWRPSPSLRGNKVVRHVIDTPEQAFHEGSRETTFRDERELDLP